MEVKMLPFLLFIMVIVMRSTHAVTILEDGRNSTSYDNNNPYNLPVKKVLFYQYGVTLDLYKTDNVVRNLVVPISGYKGFPEAFPVAVNHPPVFFNMYKDGKCLGQFVLKNLTAHKINDGRGATFELPDLSKPSIEPDELDKNVYIGAADGIYVYNMDTEAVAKYGTITEDIIALDKVHGKDEFYIVNADHKIYKVINNGSEVIPIEAINYAKQLVLDLFENVYFIGEDNVPQVLMKGEGVPYKFSEFNFNVVNPVLGRQVLNLVTGKNDILIPFIVDGVLYILNKNQSGAVPTVGVVPGVTAVSAEFTFEHFYAVDGLIYLHSVLGREIPRRILDEVESAERSSSENENETERPVKVFDRDARAEYKTFKKIKRRH